jgi:hypothetical protein
MRFRVPTGHEQPAGPRRRAAGCAAGRPPALAATVIAAVTVLAAGCAGAGSGHAAASAGARPPASTSTPGGPGTRGPSASASPGPTPRGDASPRVIAVPLPPANLHQTRAFPSAHARVFRSQMTDLWAAVVTGRARLALQAFFPLSAYQQVKAISNPAADWHNRLWADFRLDVGAAHRLVGHDASLVRVIVPSAQAAWIGPGACYNSVSYWHVGGARLLYRKHGRFRSIGIASLISWRGRWYVVHFGAVLRNGGYGIVDQPAAGPGVPGPAGGC